MDDSSTPVQCSLVPKEAAGQLLEWVYLRSHAVRSEALANGVRMTFTAAHHDALEDLAVRESACCSFLDLSLERAGELVTLQVTSDNPQAHHTIALISGVGTP